MTSNWQGLYSEGWQGEITPEAFAHPAKYARGLIRRIYHHMITEGWLKPGDQVIDPFGGVALGALDAMKSGLHWTGVELEPRFVDLGGKNIALWMDRYSDHFPGWGTARLVQGDSRELCRVLEGQAAGAVSSPPYADSMEKPNGIDAEKIKRPGGPNSQSKNDTRYSAAVSSPPYADGARHTGGNDPHPEHIEGGEIRLPGIAGAVSSPPYAESLGNAEKSGIDWSKQADRESEHPHGWNGQGYSAAVTSPPYATSDPSRTNSQGTSRIDPNSPNYRPSAVRKHEHMEIPIPYGSTPGQLGAMKAGDWQASVGSPPFESGSEGVLRADKFKDPKAIARVQMNKGHGASFEAKLKAMEKNNEMAAYGSTLGNIGNTTGDTFWQAARQIVEQVHLALAPGGHAVWVVKAFVKNKQIVDFPGQWQAMCDAVGFETLHVHRAWLVEHKGTQFDLDGNGHSKVTERKSFFRRLAEKKGSPRIDWETVICMEKPK